MDPIMIWAMGWLLTKAADTSLRRALTQGISTDLAKTVRDWVKSLPPGYHLDAKSLFSNISEHVDPKQEPRRNDLQNELREHHVPSQKLWKLALFERWNKGRKTYDHEIYQRSEAEVEPHFDSLGDALHNVCLRHIDLLGPHIAQLLEFLSARSLQMGHALSETLEKSRQDATSRDERYMTPHLLLALLGSRADYVRRCFEHAEPGLSGRVQAKLGEYKSTEKYAPFDWHQRQDILEAERIAREEQAILIVERHLLIAVLQGESSTVDYLRTALGPGKFESLKNAALDLQGASAGIGATTNLPPWM